MYLSTKAEVLMAECDEHLRETLLELSKQDILNFCHIEELPAELEDVQLKIAVKYYNRMGQEGSSSYSEGGKSQSFEDLFTPDIKRQLYRFRRLP